MDEIISTVNNTSMIKVLLLFYILIGNSLLEPLLSKQWKQMVKENRLIQHVIGLTTLIALTTFVSEGKMNNLNIIIYSLAGYLWFIFSTKMDIHWNIIVIILLLSAYMYENSLKVQANEILNDKVLKDEEKINIVKANDNKKIYISLAIIFITLIGMFLYSDRKEIQYGGEYGQLGGGIESQNSYSLVKFLLY
jgi:hypothetical protein